jgi:8-oxo-dGTP pyrophosphatase MutT (NUDIX family)
MEQIIHTLQTLIPLLPGKDAQYLMAPPIRKLYANAEEYKVTAKQAAVCVALHLNEANEWCVYLMQRTAFGVHANQISFPGGRVELTDASYYNAAIREFNEEIGTLNNPAYIGMLTPLYIPPSNFYVEPYLIVLKDKLIINASEKEVVQVLSLKLTDLFNNNNVGKYTSVLPNGTQTEVPCIALHNTIIWGATAMIISELKQWCTTHSILT